MPDYSFKTISATSISTLYGINPYRTLYDLFQEFGHKRYKKVHVSDAMIVGSLIEGVIVELARQKLKLDIVENINDKGKQDYYIHSSGVLGCTPDAWTSNRQTLIECKNVSETRFKADWSEDKAPTYIEYQLQAQMLVMDIPTGHIVALVGGNKFKNYYREADKALHEDMLTKCKQFFDKLKTGEWKDIKETDLHPVVTDNEEELKELVNQVFRRRNNVLAELRAVDKTFDDILRLNGGHHVFRLAGKLLFMEPSSRTITVARD